MTQSVNVNWPLNELKSKAVTSIINSLDNHPDDWQWTSKHYSDIKHKTSRIELSVGLGDMHLDSPYKVKFGWINWFKLRRAFKRWKKKSGGKQKLTSEKHALVSVITSLS